jgi:ubiquinol-cytochrome c reductase subunit 6
VESELSGDSDCVALEMKCGAEALNDVYRLEEPPEQVLTTFPECMKSQQCAPLKHHYDECAERVTQQQEENGKADEDCVEECMLRPLPDHCQHGMAGHFARVPTGITSMY